MMMVALYTFIVQIQRLKTRLEFLPAV